jgi:5-bromo-4-chloroindolyl phosphate hydrolysis protein
MDNATRKAAVALLNQIKTTVVTLEDIILNSVTDKLISFEKTSENVQKSRASGGDLSDNEEKYLEESLERERLAIMESDKVLKDLWAQGAK